MNEKLVKVGRATLATVMATSMSFNVVSTLPIMAEETDEKTVEQGLSEQALPEEQEETNEGVVESTQEDVDEATKEDITNEDIVKEEEMTPEQEEAPTVYATSITVPIQANNIALGKHVTTSSNETNDFVGSKLVDGSGAASSRWSSAQGSSAQWVQIDLQQVYTISGVNLFWESGKATGYSVQVSKDGTAWEDVYVNTTHPTSITDRISFTKSYEARYVKLNIHGVSNHDPLGQVVDWPTISLYEIQVLEKENVDKTELQNLYNEVSNKRWEYLPPNYVASAFHTALEKANEVLQSETATLQDVQKAKDKLHLEYQKHLLKDKAAHYLPKGSFSSNDKFGAFDTEYEKYTTDSCLVLVNAANSGWTNASYDDLNNLKEKSDAIDAAVQSLVLFEANKGGSHGLPKFAVTSPNGTMEVHSELKGNKVLIQLTFKNDGINPYTKKYDANSKFTESGLREAKFVYDYINKNGKKTNGYFDMSTRKPLDNNYNNGVVASVELDKEKVASGDFIFGMSAKDSRGNIVTYKMPGLYKVVVGEPEKEPVLTVAINGKTFGGESLQDAANNAIKEGFIVNENFFETLEFTKGTVTEEDLNFFQKEVSKNFLTSVKLDLDDDLTYNGKDKKLPNNFLQGAKKVESVSLKGWTTLGSMSLYGTTRLKSVNVPDVEVVEYDAFGGHCGIETLSLPKAKTLGRNAFYGADNLVTLEIPNVETIEGSAFYGVGKLKSVTFGQSIKNIEDIRLGYYDGQDLNITFISEKAPVMNENTFDGEGPNSTVTVPANAISNYFGEKVTDETIFTKSDVKEDFRNWHLHAQGHFLVTYKVNNDAWMAFVPNKEAIGNQRMPQNVQAPEGQTFVGWKDENGHLVTKDDKVSKDLTLVPVFEKEEVKVTALVNGTSVGGKDLASIIAKSKVAEENVTSIELQSGVVTKADLDYINTNLAQLNTLKLNLKDTLKYVGEGTEATTILPTEAFKGHIGLENIELKGFTEIGENAFEDTNYLKNVIIPDVVTIKASAFRGNGASSLDLPNVEVIEGRAFEGNSKIQTIHWPKLKVVEKNAFYRADNFTTFTLPSSLESIGDKAFVGAKNGIRKLNITSNIENPDIKFGEGAFAQGTITVPENTLPNYLKNLDLTKSFKTSGDTKWNGLEVKDPAYHFMKYFYTEKAESYNTSYGYVKVGAPLNSVTEQYTKVPDGKRFKGWTTKKNGQGTFVDPSSVPTKDMVLYVLFGENTLPEIHASKDIVLYVGDSFDALKDVTATDAEDGDLTKDIKVVENTVDTTKVGTYTVKYEVTDCDGGKTSIHITVVVQQPLASMDEVPTIYANDVTLTVGDSFDALKDVTATDAEDGDLTKDIKVVENTVDTTKAGTYIVEYEVTDSQGAKATKRIRVTVNSKQEVVNQAPVIHAKDVTLTVGDSFDALKDVTATDVEDGDLTKEIKVIVNTVDTKKAGTYKVGYEVTDSQGAKTTKYVTVIVKDKAMTTPSDKKDPDKSNGTNTGVTTGLFASILGMTTAGAAVLELLKKRKK